MSMPDVAFPHAAASAAAAPADRANPFWQPAIGGAAASIAALGSHVDTLSLHISRLQPKLVTARPAVSHYLDMARALAMAWSGRSRPALAAALEGMRHVGDGMASPALEAGLDGDRAWLVRALDTLERRLAPPILALDGLDADLRGALARMASATCELDTDTVLVTQRLQAGQVHAFVLSQQANAMQAKLDGARAQQRAAWLLGPRAGQIRKEVALHSSALDGVRRQLDHLRTEQAALTAEAASLQQLLPVLSCYLDATDRMGTAIHALLAGAREVQAGLGELRRGAGLAQAGAHLRAALPCWSALPKPL